MTSRSVLPLALVAACAPAAYAPPARPISLDAPTAPARGGTDAQAELGRIGTIFGPDLVDGNVRVRHALSDRVVIEGESGMAHVANAGTIVAEQPVARVSGGSQGTPSAGSGGSRDAYTGRAGVMLHGRDGLVQGALTAGIGGGYAPTAGGWTSLDVGASVGGAGRWVRPWAAYELGVNEPWSSRVFVVSDGDSETALALTSDMMMRATLGLEVGPDDRAAVIGMSFTHFYADTNGVVDAPAGSGGDTFIAIAAGFRARL